MLEGIIGKILSILGSGLLKNTSVLYTALDALARTQAVAQLTDYDTM